MDWHKLTAKDLPPVDNRRSFLLWLGVHEDGGFPVQAKRVQYNDNPPYIRYVTPSGWRVLENPRGVLWAEIEEPEAARKRQVEWERGCVHGQAAAGA